MSADRLSTLSGRAAARLVFPAFFAVVVGETEGLSGLRVWMTFVALRWLRKNVRLLPELLCGNYQLVLQNDADSTSRCLLGDRSERRGRLYICASRTRAF